MPRTTLSWPLSVIALMLGVIALILASPTQAPQAAGPQQYSDPYTTPATSTSTTAPTATTQQGTGGGGAVAASSTPSLTSTTGTSVPTNTSGPTNTSAPIAAPTAPPGVEGAIACLPGQTIYIEGEGPPNTALLLYFDDQPVGGGTSDARGHYRLKLVMGNERSGTYRVQVRVRGTRRVLQEIVCGVLENTPTPTRARRTTPP